MKNSDSAFSRFGTVVIYTIACCTLLFTHDLKAQESSGIKDSMYSAALKERRSFEIILPKEYETEKNQKYEVIYVLDGQYYVEQIPFIYNWTVASGFMPQAILVIIPNIFIEGVNQRMRDFTPTRRSDEENEGITSGGADQFLSFICTELDPHIDQEYRTNGNRSIIGSSLSGLFVSYAFIKDPDAFNSFIASDPSLWWDDQYVAKLAKEKISTTEQGTGTFWMAGLRDTYADVGIKTLDSIMSSFQKPIWKCEIYENETHFSVQHKAFYDGLRFSFLGYNSARNLRYHPANGIIAANKPILVHIFEANSNVDIRYTLDGTDPRNQSSKVLKGEDMVIAQPTSLKIKVFGNRKEFSPIIESRFKSETLLLEMPIESDSSSHPLKYSYSKKVLHDFTNPGQVDIVSEDIAPNAQRIILKRNKFRQIHKIEGTFHVDQEGYYIFGITSKAGAKLSIGGLKILEFAEGENPEQSFIVPLKKGFYPIIMELFTVDDVSDIGFITFYAGDGSTPWWESEPSYMIPKIELRGKLNRNAVCSVQS